MIRVVRRAPREGTSVPSTGTVDADSTSAATAEALDVPIEDREQRPLTQTMQTIRECNPIALDALEALAAIKVPEDNRPIVVQRANLQADAHIAANEPNQALAALEAANKLFPNPRLQQRIASLKH